MTEFCNFGYVRIKSLQIDFLRNIMYFSFSDENNFLGLIYQTEVRSV